MMPFPLVAVLGLFASSAAYALLAVPAAALAALVGVLLTASLQRRHWLRTTHEEIRTRETREATELVRDIAKMFDARIAAQRLFLRNIATENSDKMKAQYSEAIRDYMSGYNEIRYRLMSYHSYAIVHEFDEKLNNRIVRNGALVSQLEKDESRTPIMIRRADEDLSIISAQLFRFCARLHDNIGQGNIGTLPALRSWSDPTNPYVTNWALAKRLLNI